MARTRAHGPLATRSRRCRAAVAAVAAVGAALAAWVPGLLASPAPAGTGLVAWWRMEMNAADVTGNHTGAGEPTFGWGAGRAGSGLSLTGAGAIVVPDDPALYPGAGSFTVDAWFRTTVPGFTAAQTIVSHAECANTCGPTSTAEYAIRIDATGHLTGVLRDAAEPNPAQVVTAPSAVTTLAWHHTALVRDVTAGTMSLYMDGVAVQSAPLLPEASGTIADDDAESDQLMIGATREVTAGAPRRDFFTGAIDEVSYWSRALSAAEISAISVAGAEGKTIDSTPPSSQALAPPSSALAVFNVPFVAVDDNNVTAPTGASGVSHVDLYVRPPGAAAFQFVASKTTAPLQNGSFAYTATAGNGTYEFYTVAGDRNGNTEATPGVRDTATAVTVAPVTPPAATPPASTPAPTTPRLVVGPPQTFNVGKSRIRAPRKISQAGLIAGRCVNVTVIAKAPLTVAVTIYSGRRSLRLFGKRTTRFTAPGKRVVCVPIPKRAKSFNPRDGLTLDIRAADLSRVTLKVGKAITKRMPIAVLTTSQAAAAGAGR